MGYATVLVPLDGSDFARRSIDEAKKLTRPPDGRILLVGVVEVPTAQFDGYAEFVSGIDVHERIRSHLEKMLREEVEALRRGGYEADLRVREGVPHEQIAALCEEEAVEVIVMTTHGRTGFAHLLLGSVAEKVVRSAPCSVLVVRPSRDEFPESRPARRGADSQPGGGTTP